MATSTSLPSMNASFENARLPGIAKLAYALMFVGVLVLAASGIGTFALGKAPMTHWVLMGHVGCSGMFSVGLALVALTWPRYGTHHTTLARGLMWLVLLAGLIVILSGVVPMTPIFGTEGQHVLYLTHRYGAIVLTPLVLLHLLCTRSR